MPFFLLHHQHEAHECAAAFAAWQGFESPLRHRRVRVELPLRRTRALVAGGRLRATAQALALLPRFVAQRTHPIQVREVEIP